MASELYKIILGARLAKDKSAPNTFSTSGAPSAEENSFEMLWGDIPSRANVLWVVLLRMLSAKAMTILVHRYPSGSSQHLDVAKRLLEQRVFMASPLATYLPNQQEMWVHAHPKRPVEEDDYSLLVSTMVDCAKIEDRRFGFCANEQMPQLPYVFGLTSVKEEKGWLLFSHRIGVTLQDNFNPARALWTPQGSTHDTMVVIASLKPQSAQLVF